MHSEFGNILIISSANLYVSPFGLIEVVTMTFGGVPSKYEASSSLSWSKATWAAKVVESTNDVDVQ